MQALVFEELGTSAQNTLFKNLHPLTNWNSIVTELQPTIPPAVGLNTPSVAGWCIWDEPPIFYPPNNPPADSIFSAIHWITKLVRDSTTSANSFNKLAFANLVPISWAAYPWYQPGCDPDTLLAYRCYLDKYLSSFNNDALPAPLLCFDAYPFEAAWASRNWYFVNLATVRDKALQYSRANYRIPFWSVIQAAPRCTNNYSSCEPTPSFKQIRWQAYVSLAYGAKGILYWTLREARGDSASVPLAPSWAAAFLKADGTRNGALYDSLKALNTELRMLGSTLMTLDPVATYHVSANGFKLPAEEDTLGNPNRTYKIVASLVGTNNQGMVGYFKSRIAGADYLLVVNKDTTVAQSFTVTLSNQADSVYRVSKVNGQLQPLTTNSTTFSTGIIRPGGGELFRVMDQTYEYIADVNRIVSVGDTTWYAHQKGVAMVVRSTGRRIHFKNGTNYTPVPDLAVTRDHVFLMMDDGTNACILRTDRELLAHYLFYAAATGLKGISAQWAESCIVLVERPTATTSNVKLFNSAGVVETTLTFNNAGAPSTPWVAYDVQYQEGLGSFVVAHGRYYTRYLAKSHWTQLNRKSYRTPIPTNVRLTALGTGLSQLLFAGRQEETGFGAPIGGVEKMSYDLVRPPSFYGWWPQAGAEPPVKDIHAAGNHVLAGATTAFGGGYFVRLRAIDLSSMGYRSTDLPPTAVALTPDSIAFMASASGIARSSQTDLAGRFSLTPVGGNTGDSLAASIPAELALSVWPNPVAGDAVVRFDLPEPGWVRLEVFDIQGRLLARLVDGKLTAGRHTADWTPPVGRVLFLRLRTGGKSLSTRVSVLR